jgi:hypothetical protein
VEEANRVSPRHSRICKEMILVTNPLKLLGRTTKGTPDRTAILANYDTEIEEVYRAMESRLSEDRCYHDKAKRA